MNFKTLKLISDKTRKSLLKPRQNRILLGVLLAFSFLSLIISFDTYRENREKTAHYREEMRHGWENRPDKHPHRMAHYGYVALRDPYPLVIFDKGIDDYLGNMIFLEAHKQNSANLSQAGSSGILVRFGVFSPAFILQVLVPLVIFFLGYGLVSNERENTTLKILHLQGASAKEILWGKTFGLWQFSFLILLPVLVLTIIFGIISSSGLGADILIRSLITLVLYAAVYFVLSAVAVAVSARSSGSSRALISLIGIWLLFTVFLPKITQFAAQNLYPAPSRIAFETAMEDRILETGDSHNPDDIHFKKLKDSVLAKYKVDTVAALPFNYTGFVMQEGEKITSHIYKDEIHKLQKIYGKELNFAQAADMINPVATLKNCSAALSGTDYDSYADFQDKAERYRYYLTQRMNKLQIKLLSNYKPKPNEPPQKIDRKYWRETKDFHYRHQSWATAVKSALLSVTAVLFWLIFSALILNYSARHLKFTQL